MERKGKNEARKGAVLFLVLATAALFVFVLLKRPAHLAHLDSRHKSVSEKLEDVRPAATQMEESPGSASPQKGASPGFVDADEYLRRLSELSMNHKEEALLFARQEGATFGQVGLTAEARDAMAVTLLVDLGRMEEARAAVRRFVTNFPASRYRALVQGVTGIHPRPGPPEHISP